MEYECAVADKKQQLAENCYSNANDALTPAAMRMSAAAQVAFLAWPFSGM